MRRIEQTILLLKKISSQLEQRATAGNDLLNWLSETEIYVEAFYWFAFSAARALHFLAVHMKRERLIVPCFTKFDENVVGVRNVRNQLIEHSEKEDGVLVGLFAGLKVLDSGDILVKYEEPWVWSLLRRRPHPDPGLFANVNEFFNKLKRCSELSSEPLVARGAKIIRTT